jgi:RNA-directed DNA polymerase
MNNIQYKRIFSEKARLNGCTKHQIERCLTYAENLFRHGVPVIYNAVHLSLLCGFKNNYLLKAITRTPFYYRTYKVAKKKGGFRNIKEPLPGLKQTQQWILRNILESVPVSRFAKAYKKNVPLRENARFHQHQPMVLTVDLVDFFGSIDTKSIQRVFRSFGYAQPMASLLAKLCTLNNQLPQGAPTSPYLSNLVFRELDQEIAAYCIKRNIRYTRYADDLAFSGDFNPEEVLQFLASVFRNGPFILNTKKTRIMRRYQRQTVTGIVVNNKTQAPASFRRQVRQELYYIQKFGLVEHARMQGKSPFSYYEQLKGRIQFIQQVNPSDNEPSVQLKTLLSMGQVSFALYPESG